MESKVKEIIHQLDCLPDEAVEKVAIFIAGMRAHKGLADNEDKPPGGKLTDETKKIKRGDT